MKKDDIIAIRISGQLKQKLQQMADNDDRSLGDFIRLRLEKIVLEEFINESDKSFAEKEERIKRIASKINGNQNPQ